MIVGLQHHDDFLKTAAETIRVELGDQYAAIFEAHLAMLHDAKLQQELATAVRDRNWWPEYAVSRTLRRYAKVFQSLDSHISQRAHDIYDTEKSRPVAVVLRPGKTPGGAEVRAHLRRLVRRIRARWPTTRITFRGDGHYARPEAMAWCEDHGVDYVFGLPGNRPLAMKVDETAEAVRVERALENRDVVRAYAETRYRARSWDRERRAIARIEATRLGLDVRFVVTNLPNGAAQWLYDSLYCARGQAENLIKLHKTQLCSDRTSCRSALANQVRLVLRLGLAAPQHFSQPINRNGENIDNLVIVSMGNVAEAINVLVVFG